MISPKHLILLTIWTISTSVAHADEKACTAHVNGKYYDLNPLRSSSDYELKTINGRLLVFNICGRIARDTFGMKDIDSSKIAGFLRRDHGDISIGALNTTITVFESRPRLTFLEGSPCHSQSDNQDDQRASAVIDFVCDTSVFGAGKPRLVASFPPYDDENACGFAIEWRTHLACPTSEEGGGWGIIAILAVTILSFLMLYAIAGTLYNRFVLNLRGFDQIPQFSLESMRYHAAEAWDWAKDVMEDYRHNGGFRSYQGFRPGPGQDGILGQRDHPSTNPVSHYTQSQADTDSGSFRPGSGDAGSVDTIRSGFVRPTPRSGLSVRTVETNPISHHTQTQQAQFEDHPEPAAQPPSPPPKNPAAPPQELSQVAPREHREFTVGDDDNDEQELEDIGSETSSSSEGSSAPASRPNFPSTSIGRGGGTQPRNDAASRGRDLGGGGTIRL